MTGAWDLSSATLTRNVVVGRHNPLKLGRRAGDTPYPWSPSLACVYDLAAAYVARLIVVAHASVPKTL